MKPLQHTRNLIESTHKLCYIEKNVAYFTNAPLDSQYGHNWDVAGYEENACWPQTGYFKRPAWSYEEYEQSVEDASTDGFLESLQGEWVECLIVQIPFEPGRYKEPKEFWLLLKEEWKDATEYESKEALLQSVYGYNLEKCPYYAQQMVHKRVPWLKTPNEMDVATFSIYAGVTVSQFATLIEFGGGKVYVEQASIMEHDNSF